MPAADSVHRGLGLVQLGGFGERDLDRPASDLVRELLLRDAGTFGLSEQVWLRLPERRNCTWIGPGECHPLGKLQNEPGAAVFQGS